MTAGHDLRAVLAADRARIAPLLGRQRSWWLREALAADPGAACPPLTGDASADVAIVGGGFTGLWTAWQLIERAPGIRVSILESDIVGGGASGRNGGFLTGLWDSLPALIRAVGEEGGLAIADALDRTPTEIGSWCDRYGVDAWFRPGGTLVVASSAVQDGAWDEVVELTARLGRPGRIIPLDPAAVRARSGSPVLRGGALLPGDASIQPARLARGLRRVLLERGVTIHEGSRVRRLVPGHPTTLELDGGALRADQVVLALNAWAAGWPGFGSRLVTWSSYVVLTEPIPDRLAGIGYTGDEAISDSRFTNHYWRPTADGRIAFGGGGGRAGFGGRLDEARPGGSWTTGDLGSAMLAARGFRRLYPALRDVAIEEAWGGPIDIAPNHLPSFHTLPPGNVHAGHGYSGTGVGPAHLGGRILAALALRAGSTAGPDTAEADLPLAGLRPRQFPPEPFRYLGARVIREAIVAKEGRDDAGRDSPALLRGLVRLPRAMGYDLGPE